MIDMMRKTALLLVMLAACSGADTRDTTSGVAVDSMPAVAGHASGTATALPGGATRERVTRKNILFLGTSLTAGYGVGEEYAYPAIIQDRIDSAGLPYHVINAGISGETSAGGLRRLDWSLQQPIDVLVLELGANDGLRGMPVAQLRANLDTIIDRTKARYPDAAIVITGMQAPPNLGRTYTDAFAKTFTDLAAKHQAALVPFLLKDVGGIRELNQGDGIHPTQAGHRIVASNVWKVLEPLLEKRAGRPTSMP
jgi:acyl-CoA thioesterase I